MVWCLQHLSYVGLEFNKVSHMSSYYAGAVWRYVKQVGVDWYVALPFHLYPERVGVEGYSWGFFVGVCRPVLKSWHYFRPKICHFTDLFSDQTSKIHTCFQVPDLAFRQKLCHHYLDSVCKQKKLFKCISNSHISTSFLFFWNWNNKYAHTLP